MRQLKIKLENKHSASLMSLIGRKNNDMKAASAASLSGMASMSGGAPGVITKDDRVSVLIDCKSDDEVGNYLSDMGAAPEALAKGYISARVNADAAEKLIGDKGVRRVQTKKLSQPVLDNALVDCGRRDDTGANPTGFDGTGVAIGVVDSGFDLSHPMFRDAAGNLRVDGLLDQTTGQQFTQAQLEAQWSGGNGPGADDNGHGTHVASIAGGSAFGQFEGVAPGARFFLVKTDFLNTDTAVSWIFNQAGSTPCVVNLSLGHHFGSHDGTSAEERLFRQLAGPGRLICVAAGNEQNDDIHIGGRFVTNEIQTVQFDIFRQPPPEAPRAVITLWYDREDRFDFELITPTGQALDVPALGNAEQFQGTFLDIELAKKRYLPSQLKQVQIVISFTSNFITDQWLSGWSIRARCRRATVGRLDGWFSNSGFGRFHGSPMIESARTVGLSGTGDGTITVASHVTKNQWDSDAGQQVDNSVVLGRNSPFSSRGPNRLGEEKPEISAPGQYVTAALATGSELSNISERAENANQLLNIEGTSMACPVVTGVIALMLEKRADLTTQQCRQILSDTGVKDTHTGASRWTPAYGYGKIDAVAALNQT